MSACLCTFARGRSTFPDENKFAQFLKDGFLPSGKRDELEKITCMSLDSGVRMVK